MAAALVAADGERWMPLMKAAESKKEAALSMKNVLIGTTASTPAATAHSGVLAG